MNWSSALDMLGQFFVLLVIFAFIIALAVFSLKYASRFKNYAGGNNNLRVIESRALGLNNYVHLVKAGDKYFMVGASKGNVSFLAEIDKDSVTDVYDNPNNQPPTIEQFKKLLKKQMPPKE